MPDMNEPGDNNNNEQQESGRRSVSSGTIAMDTNQLREMLRSVLQEMGVRPLAGGAQAGEQEAQPANSGIREGTDPSGDQPGEAPRVAVNPTGAPGTSRGPEMEEQMRNIVRDMMTGNEEEGRRQSVKADSLKAFVFTGTDYNTWSSQMKRILKHADLWDTVMTRLPPHAPPMRWMTLMWTLMMIPPLGEIGGGAGIMIYPFLRMSQSQREI